jgi:parallel beta-helix repeat protein
VPTQPAAFMSYVRFNDQHDDGQLTQFRERLSAEVRVQTGEEFPIFQDRNDITWGQAWQQRIDETLDEVTLLIVIITPSFFRSPACRKEVERFLEREHKLARQDLILPVYYVDAQELNDSQSRDKDELAKILASRQFADWRELRFEPFTSPAVRKALAKLATRMRENFWRLPAEDSFSLGERIKAGGLKTGAANAIPTVKATARVEPPTHVVDPYQRGNFVAIAEAIEKAKPGDRILVRPGLYTEGLVIDKPLEILGDGPVEDVEVKVQDNDAIVFKANIGRIANLTIRQIGGDGKYNAVDITQGRLDLEGCDISSESQACVLIRNGADPRLRRNRIHDGSAEGVMIYDDTRATLEDNEIFDNADDGVTVMDGSNPTLRRNQIHDNDSFGVNCNDGSGIFEDNDIASNAGSGMIVQYGSNPVARRNKIHDNGECGVHATGPGRGLFEDNEISGNRFGGFAVSESGNPIVRHNSIHNNKQNGIFVYEEGLGEFENNDIVDNMFNGLAVQELGNPTLRQNRINGNRYHGIHVSRDGKGTYERNELTDNTKGPWLIADEAVKNVIRKNNRQ